MGLVVFVDPPGTQFTNGETGEVFTLTEESAVVIGYEIHVTPTQYAHLRKAVPE